MVSPAGVDLHTYILIYLDLLLSFLQEFYPGGTISGEWAVWQDLQATDCCYLLEWSLASQQSVLEADHIAG